VHPAVPEGGDRAGVHRSPARLLRAPRVSGEGLLLHHEQRQSPVTGRTILVGAGEHQQVLGAAPERAPRLDAVEDPVVTVARGGDLHPGDVRADVGFGHGDRTHLLAGGHRGQPGALLLLGPTLEDRGADDLWPGDQRAGDAEGAARQLLGDQDHVDQFVLAALGHPPVLGGDRQGEAAELREAGDHLLGEVEVLAVDLLGDRDDPLLREAPEGLAHHLQILGEVALTGFSGRQHRVGDLGGELEGPAGGDGLGLRREDVGADTPCGLATGDAAAQVGGDVRRQQQRQLGFQVTLLTPDDEVFRGGQG
jgi:hypothetical protein